MKVIGTEWLIEASGCDADALCNIPRLQHLFNCVITELNLNPLGDTPFTTPSRAPSGLKFLDDATMAGMFVLPIDLAPVEVQINRLDNQALVHYYETELRRLQ